MSKTIDDAPGLKDYALLPVAALGLAVYGSLHGLCKLVDNYVLGYPKTFGELK